jgi:hypothetical protein
MDMAMTGQDGHRWARFHTRLFLPFDFSHVIFACTKNKNKTKGEGEPGNEAIVI